MIIKLILRLLLGYVRIEVEGYYVEKFINICTNRKILIWNLKRKNGVKLLLNIGIKDFKIISKICKKTNCKVKIVKRRGMPFLLNKYKKRKIFLISLVTIFILIFISSNYIWNIEIKVQDNLEIENIQQDLENIGLKKGILKKNIDTIQIINEIRLKRDDISWVGIDINGTNVKVNIAKAKESPEIIDNSDCCDIVASKPGEITKIIAQNGTAMVKAGDFVQTGDVLIGGFIDGKYTERRKVHSLGEVIAKVKYELSEEISFSEEYYQKTGNYEKKYEINISNFKIKLYKNLSKFDLFETENAETNLRIAQNFYLPVSINKIINYETRIETRNNTMEECINIASDRLEKELNEKILYTENIINKYIKTEEKENSVVVSLIYEVLENIGVFKK